MGRLTGRSIILYDKVKAGVDDFNRPIYTETPVTVDNVLIGSPSPQEVVDTLNLTGKRAAYTLGIPKGDTHTWTDRCRWNAMSNFQFVRSDAGVRELMQSQEMQDVLVDFAQQVAEKAGDGYDVYIGINRANVSVRTATEEAMADNLDHNTLEKAIR